MKVMKSIKSIKSINLAVFVLLCTSSIVAQTQVETGNQSKVQQGQRPTDNPAEVTGNEYRENRENRDLGKVNLSDSSAPVEKFVKGEVVSPISGELEEMEKAVKFNREKLHETRTKAKSKFDLGELDEEAYDEVIQKATRLEKRIDKLENKLKKKKQKLMEE